ncbi:hypothetical protein [Streptomyces sp. IB2014 016-6]|uniref:hypothetical protein n=1 Tax=Streptomyces sp. IB2014 016-6 TaxID=2517818 RepID=UPI0011C74690|nr:hypothetical protein EW053_28950 [Streptomyces sp. IB2014 016-6]
MTTGLPATSREIRLAAVPDGLPDARHFTVVRTPLPSPGPGQVLVRNQHFLVFPGLRTLIGGEVEGVPPPAPRAGDTLFGPAVEQVVAASGASELKPGDTVSHLLGRREYALVPATECALRRSDGGSGAGPRHGRSEVCCGRRTAAARPAAELGPRAFSMSSTAHMTRRDARRTRRRVLGLGADRLRQVGHRRLRPTRPGNRHCIKLRSYV